MKKSAWINEQAYYSESDGWTYLAIDGTKMAHSNLSKIKKSNSEQDSTLSSPIMLDSHLYDISKSYFIDAAQNLYK